METMQCKAVVVRIRQNSCLNYASKYLIWQNFQNGLGNNINSSLMMEAVRTSETSVDNHFTRQYIPEDNSEHH
jgi:hypothetical protein